MNNKSNHRAQQLKRYIQALENGDIVAMSAILEQAEADKELEDMMIAYHRKSSLLGTLSEILNDLEPSPKLSRPRSTSGFAISFIATSIVLIVVGAVLITSLFQNGPNNAAPSDQTAPSMLMSQADSECDARLTGDDNEVIMYFDDRPDSRLYQTLDRPIIILGVRDEEHYDILWDFVVAYIHQDEVDLNDCETFPVTVEPRDLQVETTTTPEPTCEAMLADDNRIIVYATRQGDIDLGKTVFDVEMPFVVTGSYGALNQLLEIQLDSFTGYILVEEVDLGGCADFPIRVSPLP